MPKGPWFRVLGLHTVALALVMTSFAQTTIKIDVNAVNLLAVVRDKDGRLVPNLEKDDFILEEGGHPQSIKYFSRQASLPLTIGLMVDISSSQDLVLDAERQAGESLLAQMVRPEGDAAFVLLFGRDVELWQDFTSSKEQLLKATLHVQERGNLRLDPPREPRCGWRGTLLYEAIELAASKMRKRQGRKALVILSDGVDVGSCTSLNDVIEFAQRANTMVYAVYFAGVGSPGVKPKIDGEQVLRRIAEETGGHLFKVSASQTVEQIYVTIEAELRNQYSLGFTSDRKGVGYRKLHVRTTDPNLVVQARDGYYAEP